MLGNLTQTITPEEEQIVQKLPLLDKIINNRGYKSPEQWRIIAFTTIAISLEGMHFNILGMILIPLKKLYNLSDYDIQLASGIMMIFVALGSVMSGHLIKKFPRMNVINNSILATFILHLLMGMFQNFVFYVLVRILLGISIGIFIPLITNLLCEYCPIHRRSFVFNATWVGYNLGCLFFATSQLYIMPDLEEDKLQKLLLFTSILPLTVYILLRIYLRDSPRNLILMGNDNEAFRILEKFKGTYIEDDDRRKMIEDVKHGVNKELGGHFRNMFKTKYKKMTFLLIFLWFTIYMLYYGPFLILSWVIRDIDQNEEGLHEETNTNIIKDEIKVYLIGCIGYFLGGMVSEMKIFGRKKGIIFGLTFCIVFTFLGINIPQYFVVFFGIYFIFLNIPLIVIDIYSCELYPTKIRDIAVGFLFACCRIGSCVANILYVDLYRIGTFVPFYAVIVTCIIDIILCYKVPYETFGAALDTQFKSKREIEREKKQALLAKRDFKF